MMTRWFSKDGLAALSHEVTDKKKLGMIAGIAVYSFIIIAGVISLRAQVQTASMVVTQASPYDYGFSGHVGLAVFTTLCVFAFAAPFLLAMLWSIPAAIVLLVMKHYHYHFHAISSPRPSTSNYSWWVAHP